MRKTVTIALLCASFAVTGNLRSANAQTLETDLRDDYSIIHTSSSTFATDVANVPEGIVIVDVDYTIPASTTLTISQRLVPAGGVIKFTNSTSKLVVTGDIQRGKQVIEQLADRSDRAVIEISHQPVCPITFGLHSDTSGVSGGVSNTDVLNDTIIAASAFGGEARQGCRVEIPSGTWYFDRPVTADEWIWPGQANNNGTDRDHNIVGHGSKKSVLKLASGTVSSRGTWADSTSYSKGDVVKSSDDGLHYILREASGTSNGDGTDLGGGSDGLDWVQFRAGFNLDDLNNGSVESLGFDGNVSGHTGTWPTYTHTDFSGDNSEVLFPLVRFSSYNFTARNLNIRRCKGTGLLIHSSQQYLIDQVDSEHHSGWGLILEGAWNATFDGLGCEHNTLGGVLVHESGVDTRDRSLGALFNQLYLEGNKGLRIQGVSGVQLRGSVYHTTGNVVELGAGARDCTVDVRTAETPVVLEDGSYRNEVWFNAAATSLSISDQSGGRNQVRPVGRDSFFWDPNVGETGSAELNDSNPAVLYTVTSSVLLEESGAPDELHPAALFISGKGVKHKRIAPIADTWTNISFVKTSLATGTYYLYMVSQVDSAANVAVRFRNNTDNKYFSPATGAYDATGSADSYISIPHTPNELRFSRIKVPSPSSVANVQIEIGTLYGDGAKLDLYHCDLSTESNKRLEYQSGGSTIGHGQYIEFSDSSRPAANNFETGVRIWNTDDSAYNYSDGSSWLDASGSGT